MASEKVDFLATVSLFSHLKEEELQRLAGQSHYCSFNFGDVIIREGERDDRLYILINDQGAWLTIEQYIMDYTEFVLSHGICPECRDTLLSKIPT